MGKPVPVEYKLSGDPDYYGKHNDYYRAMNLLGVARKKISSFMLLMAMMTNKFSLITKQAKKY